MYYAPTEKFKLYTPEIIIDMSTIIGLTNVGSLGKHESALSEVNTKVRQNLFDAVAATSIEFNKNISQFHIQECGGFDFKFSPFFSEPTSTNKSDHTPVEYRRGVCSYSINDSCFSPDRTNILNKFEFSVLVDKFGTFESKRGWFSQNFAFINIYKNNHENWSENIKDTITGIKSIIKDIRQKHQIRKFIIAGDFNNTDKYVHRKLGTDFSEYTHRSWAHKHRPGVQAHKIDRVFTNIKHFKILKVMNSAENRQDSSCG